MHLVLSDLLFVSLVTDNLVDALSVSVHVVSIGLIGLLIKAMHLLVIGFLGGCHAHWRGCSISGRQVVGVW